MDSTISTTSQLPHFAVLAAAGSDTFEKLETYLGLSKVSQFLGFDIPETLIKSGEMPRPMFIKTSETGATESFFRTAINLHLTDSFRKPSAYKVPGFIFHTKAVTRIAFDPESARRLIEGQNEFVLQRYIAAGDFIARKMRTVWTAHHHTNTLIIERTSPLPFNAPSIPTILPARRKMSFFAVLNPQERPRRRSHIQPVAMPMNTEVQVNRRNVEERGEWEKEYLVSFQQAQDFLVKEVGLHDRTPNGDLIISAFNSLPQHSGYPQLTLAALTFDMIPTLDNRWIFLSIKKIAYRNAGGAGYRGELQVQRSLDDIKACLMGELHKTPAIDMEEIQKQNILLYERLLS